MFNFKHAGKAISGALLVALIAIYRFSAELSALTDALGVTGFEARGEWAVPVGYNVAISAFVILWVFIRRRLVEDPAFTDVKGSVITAGSTFEDTASERANWVIDRTLTVAFATLIVLGAISLAHFTIVAFHQAKYAQALMFVSVGAANIASAMWLCPGDHGNAKIFELKAFARGVVERVTSRTK